MATTCHIRRTIHADALGIIINNCTVLQSTWLDAKDCRARYLDEGNNSRRHVSNEYVPLRGRDQGGRATTETRRQPKQNSTTQVVVHCGRSMSGVDDCGDAQRNPWR